MNYIHQFYDYLFLGIGMLVMLVLCGEIAWRCLAYLLKAKDLFKLFFKFCVDYNRKQEKKKLK